MSDQTNQPAEQPAAPPEAAPTEGASAPVSAEGAPAPAAAPAPAEGAPAPAPAPARGPGGYTPGGPGGHGGPRRGGPGGPGGGKRFARRKVCHFCVEKVDFIEYKDGKTLRRFVSDRGKILPRRITGTCQAHQRWLTVAIKRARNIALLHYTTD
jgi:small subunit ribosomal protein S18